MRVIQLNFNSHAMKPRVGTWGQVAKNEIRMGSSAEVTGIECYSIRVQRTGTQAEEGKEINQGRMKHGRENSDGAEVNSQLDGGAAYDRLWPERARGGNSGWFALPQRVKRPQEKPPWSSSWGLTVNARFPSPASIETLLSKTEVWGRHEFTIEFFLKDLG